MAELKPKCLETLEEIEAFVDGELEATIHVKIEHHLVDCPPCMDRAEFRRYLKVMVSSKCSGDQVPPDLKAKIERLIGLETPSA
jgi:mycothiol system anti-sigma-R factor